MTKHTDEPTAPTEDAPAGQQPAGAEGYEPRAPEEGSPEAGEVSTDTETTEDDEGTGADGGGGSDPLQAARTEAGRYRKQLRETEAERDALAAKLESLRWGVVQDKLRGLKSAELLKNNGHSIADFLDEDGTIDTARVHQIEAEFVETTGLSIRQHTDSWSRDAGKRGSHVGPGPSWSAALQTR